MTLTEWLLFLVFTPPVAVLAGMLGRKFQRDYWMLDRPYEERVADLKPQRKSAA
jgi:hypothetical protein